MVKVRAASKEDFAAFAKVLHPKNIEELKAYLGVELDPEYCLTVCYTISDQAFIISVDDQPVCIYGFIRQDSSANVWLFFAEYVDSLPLSFFRICRKLLGYVLASYRSINGRIYAGNDFAIKFAKWMGFMIERAQPYGVNGLPFHYFWKGGTDDVRS